MWLSDSVLCSEPSFVFADVIREGQNSPDGDDDKIYYFFTEVSVEYEFFGKLLIPRIARVCKVRWLSHFSLTQKHVHVICQCFSFQLKQKNDFFLGIFSGKKQSTSFFLSFDRCLNLITCLRLSFHSYFICQHLAFSLLLDSQHFCFWLYINSEKATMSGHFQLHKNHSVTYILASHIFDSFAQS